MKVLIMCLFCMMSVASDSGLYARCYNSVLKECTGLNGSCHALARVDSASADTSIFCAVDEGACTYNARKLSEIKTQYDKTGTVSEDIINFLNNSEPMGTYNIVTNDNTYRLALCLSKNLKWGKEHTKAYAQAIAD